MTAIEKIKQFLDEVSNISIGHNEIVFLSANRLENEQIGYSIDTNGISLVSEKEGDWQKKWITIAHDNLGDPFIVDTGSKTLTVLSAAHGEGIWQPFIVADSLDSFRNIVLIIKQVSNNRNHPVALGKNPITDSERNSSLQQIEKENPKTGLWFWEVYFEN